MSVTGRLLLVPNALDQEAPGGQVTDVLPTPVLAQAAAITHWVVETPKTARAFLKRVHAQVPLAVPLQQMRMTELPRAGHAGHSDGPAAMAALLAPARLGHDIGLLSDAGMPAVADPGAALVAQAHAEGIAVWPLVGPSSLLLALAASGLNGQSFAFTGYLSADDAARANRIRQLDERSRREGQTQLAIETPYRNQVLFAALKAHLSPTTRLCIAFALTTPSAWCRTLDVATWRRDPTELDRRQPAVFAWLAR